MSWHLSGPWNNGMTTRALNSMQGCTWTQSRCQLEKAITTVPSKFLAGPAQESIKPTDTGLPGVLTHSQWGTVSQSFLREALRKPFSILRKWVTRDHRDESHVRSGSWQRNVHRADLLFLCFSVCGMREHSWPWFCVHRHFFKGGRSRKTESKPPYVTTV